MKIRIWHSGELLQEVTDIIAPNKKDLWTIKDGPTYKVTCREYTHEFDEIVLNIYTEWVTGNL